MKKKVFLTFREASQFIEMNTTYLYKFLKRRKMFYTRKSDGKMFLIYEDKGKLCKIDGEDYFSFNEIKNDFVIHQLFSSINFRERKIIFLIEKKFPTQLQNFHQN